MLTDLARSKRLSVVTGVALAGFIFASVTACGSGSTASAAGGASSTVAAAASTPMSASMIMSSTPSGTTTAAMSSMIMIESFKYSVPASVAPGAEVQVMNMDNQNHTVTADSATAFDVVAIAGKTVTFKAPTTPGTYAFHCAYHSNMHGTLIVK
jgi:plastocyanin